MNLAQLLEGPAIVLYKGQQFYSARTLDAHFTQEDFPIETAAYGPIDRRARQPSVLITLQPIGEFTDALVKVLFPWTNPKFGQLVTPISSWLNTAVSVANNTITITAHGLRPGMPCMLGTFGALPSGWAADRLYYVGSVDANTIQLFNDAADAIALTNPVAPVTQGTGVSQLVEQEPLIIHTMQGNRLTFPVAAVTAMPELIFSAVATLYGAITFECFRVNDEDWSAAGSLFSADFAPYSYPGPNKSIIPTKEYTLQWGTLAPFSSFQTRGPVSARLALGLAPYETDQYGILSRKITSLTATITGQPAGMSEAQLTQYLDLQGAGTGRGVERTLNDFIITAVDDTVYARFYNAALRASPEQFDATNPRAGTLEWETARKFYGSGAVHPVFALGQEAEPS
jgi:hypothetical protein